MICKVHILIYAFLLLAPLTSFAQDLDHDRRIELLEREVRELRRSVDIITSQIELLRMQVKDRPSSDGVETTPGDEPSSSGSGSWVVKISSNTTADTSELQSRIIKTNINMKVLERRLRRNEAQLQSLNVQKANIARHHSKEKAKSLTPAIRNKKRDIGKIKSEIRRDSNLVHKWTRKIQDAKRSRLLSGSTTDGEAVVVNAKGSAADIAATIRTDEWYLVAGSARTSSGVTHINMTTATKTEAPEP